VSLGSTIYRLNTIVVVVFAVLLLGEALTVPKSAGIALGVLAVVLLYQHGGRGSDDRLLLAGVGLAVTAALLRAAFGIVSKIGLGNRTDPFGFMLYVGIGWTVAALGYAIVRRERRGSLRETLPYSVVAGALVCLVATFLLLGLRSGEASVVIPIANMSFIVAMVTSAALGMERITSRKLVAVGLAAGAIALLTGA